VTLPPNRKQMAASGRAKERNAERLRLDAQRREEVLRLPLLALRPHGVLQSPDPVDALVSVGVGAQQDVLAVWAHPADKDALRSATVQEGFARFANSTTPQPASSRIIRYRPGRETIVTVREMPVAHPMVQPLPGDRVLLVGARCRWRPEGPERNAFVLDPTGEVEAEATFGDGISEVLTTPTGDAWVGYTDEGIYGNYGWGTPRVEPIGSCGIARWSADLQPMWRYPGNPTMGPVDDCYALAVDGEVAWACYYSNFPIVRIDAGAIEGWQNEITGVDCLVTDGSRAALIGGFYGADRDRIVLGDLTNDGFDVRSTARLVLDDGSDVPPAYWVGRGSDLHVFVGTHWYHARLDDLARAV
jgi:hypothetical protein